MANDSTNLGMCRFTCANCKASVLARIPAIRIYNFPEVSGCSMSHERHTKCPKCDTAYVPIIQLITGDAKIQFGWRVVTKQQKDGTSMTSLTATLPTQAEIKHHIIEEKIKDDEGDEEDEPTGEPRKTIQ
jgi:hypothetical protein